MRPSAATAGQPFSAADGSGSGSWGKGMPDAPPLPADRVMEVPAAGDLAPLPAHREPEEC
jgi:hypothetical protein